MNEAEYLIAMKIVLRAYKPSRQLNGRWLYEGMFVSEQLDRRMKYYYGFHVVVEPDGSVTTSYADYLGSDRI